MTMTHCASLEKANTRFRPKMTQLVWKSSRLISLWSKGQALIVII